MPIFLKCRSSFNALRSQAIRSRMSSGARHAPPEALTIDPVSELPTKHQMDRVAHAREMATERPITIWINSMIVSLRRSRFLTDAHHLHGLEAINHYSE